MIVVWPSASKSGSDAISLMMVKAAHDTALS